MMSAALAIDLARTEAQNLGVPWDDDRVTATRRRLWPLPATWRVVSRVGRPPAEAIFTVSERTGRAYPVMVRYAAGIPAARHLGRGPLSAAVGAAVLGFVVARAGFGWPVWAALLFATAWLVLTPAVWVGWRTGRGAPGEPER